MECGWVTVEDLVLVVCKCEARDVRLNLIGVGVGGHHCCLVIGLRLWSCRLSKQIGGSSEALLSGSLWALFVIRGIKESFGGLFGVCYGPNAFTLATNLAQSFIEPCRLDGFSPFYTLFFALPLLLDILPQLERLRQ